MKKQRMTADNVEQLMDIVRALQQGEEPDPRKRKQAEVQTEHQTQVHTPGDEFEQILGEDSEDEFRREKKAVSEAASRAAGFLEEWKEKKKQNREKREKERQERQAEEKRKREELKKKQDGETETQKKTQAGEPERHDKVQIGESERHDKEQIRETEHQEKIQGREPERQEETQIGEPEHQEKTQAVTAEDIPHSQTPERHSEDQSEASVDQEKTDLDDTTENLLRNAARISAGLKKDVARISAGLREEPVRISGRLVRKTPEDAALQPKETAEEETEPQQKTSETTPRTGFSPKNVGQERDKKKTEADHGTGIAGKLSDTLSGAGVRIKDCLNNLGQKGIRSKELIMLAAVVMFAVLLILIAVNAVRGSLEQKRKSKNVTADKGLVVTVEDEPLSWCSSYPVQLRMYVKNEPITSVKINGEVCQPDENGIITVQAGDWILDAEVKTDSATRKARIELEYLDGDAPVLEIRKEENQINLTAVDARSSVDGIYYAETGEDAYLQMPLYQKYTGAIPYKEGTVYRFYSEDKAGNCSEPVVSTLKDAESFSLNQTQTALFPGESFGLGIKAEPEGALLKNVTYESMDTGVLSVEQNGKVTAVGNGTAAVRVTAAGMDSQVCTVTVSDKRTITVSTIGDCTLGTDQSFNTSTNFNAFDAVNGHAYFFQNVRDILSQDDVTFANLEGTLTESDTRENKQYAFKGDPSYTEVLTSGSVEVVTLANNHSSDYGSESLTDTQQALTEAGIDYCMGDTIAFREVNGIKTAFIGIYVLDVGMERESQVKETVARARKQGAKLVIVAFHWGSEKQNYPDTTQTSLAHTAIDSGADLVVGHHPHVLQGIEKYNGKYIVYSLANFCFGGNSAPSDMDTIIFQQTFTISASGVEDSDEISIIPCKVSSAAGYNNYQPTPATGEQADQIISRLNEYSVSYGQTYMAASAE